MKKVLFVGGTAFFGKRGVLTLLDGAYEVSVLTRGNVFPPEFKERVDFIRCDRSDSSALADVLKGRHFDIVVDQTASSGADVAAAISGLSSRDIEHYLLCSSAAVYPEWHTLHKWAEEEGVVDVVPGAHPFANGKREAESAIVSSGLPYTIYRPTIVEGGDDPTGRFQYFVRKIMSQESFIIPKDVVIQHVGADDAAMAINLLIELGPTNSVYNICGDDEMTLEHYCDLMSDILGKPKCHRAVAREEFLRMNVEMFPGLYDHSLLLSNSRLKKATSYQPGSMMQWLKDSAEFVVATDAKDDTLELRR